MNKIIAIALITGAASGAVHANTGSVTIYGITDVAYTYASNKAGSSYNGLDTGRWFASRLGFKGSEDLGGGLNAIFNLETGYDIDTGASSSSASFFNRIAFVGFNSRTLGIATFGRHTSPLFDNVGKLTGGPVFGIGGSAIDGTALAGSSAGRFENTMTPPRFNNSIKYTSHRMSGLRFAAMYGFGEVAGKTSANQMSSFTLDYNSNGFDAAVGYFSKDCAEATGCTSTQGKDQVLTMGGGYNFGFMDMTLVHTRQKNAKNVKNTNGNSTSFKIGVPFGALKTAIGYQVLDDRSVADQDIKQFNLGATYDMSKRTTLYSFYSKQKVANGGIASLGLLNSSNSKQNLLQVGIRHVF